jgi:hypothetical protein
VDAFARTIGAEAFTVGRDVFLPARASGATVRHELSHAKEGESPMAPIIRRKGVRSQLRAGDDRFEEFAQSTTEIRDLYEEAATDTYELYKPAKGDKILPYWKGKVSEGRRTRSGDPNDFRGRAAALVRWVNDAADSSERLYSELRAVKSKFKSDEIMDFSMNPGDTKKYPDAEINSTTALESKHVTSPMQGAVDGHIRDATAQLEKRDVSTTGQKYTTWAAVITIENEDNPWPYTPSAVKKMKKAPGKVQVEREMASRAAKYDQSSRRVSFLVKVVRSTLLTPGDYTFEL